MEVTKQKKYWVTFYSPGVFVAETYHKDFDALPDPNDVGWPNYAYSFEVYEREDVDVDGTIFKGDAVQVGPVYYHPDSKVESLAEAKTNSNSSDILIKNMENNEWTHIVWTRWGGWPQPYRPEKITILSHKGG